MKSILIIEDDPALRQDIVELLAFEGYQALDAADGTTGIEMAKVHQPDLIICDIMLPDLNGFAIIRAMRQDPTLATTPFIFVTARTDAVTKQDAMALGAAAFLTKPFRAEELLAIIAAHLSKTG